MQMGFVVVLVCFLLALEDGAVEVGDFLLQTDALVEVFLFLLL